MSMGRMMAMRGGRNSNGRRNDRRYEGTRNEYSGGMRDEYDGGIYDYDRWRYDNGRFAPKGRGHHTRAEMGDDEGIYDTYSSSSRGGGNRSGSRNSVRDYYDGGSYDSMYMRGESGYFPGDVSMHYGREHEDQRHKLGFAVSHEKMDKRNAEEWTQKMENSDGTSGPHWTPEQVQRVIEQRKLNVEFWPFYAALNAEYSDRCKVNKKHGVDSMDFYVDSVLAFWFEDKDAVKNKVEKYYECVVK